jgi:DNA repair photolyase
MDELQITPGTTTPAPQEPATTSPPMGAHNTPEYDRILAEARELDKKSKYRCDFDYTIYRDLELRFRERPIRGGIMKKSPMKLVNWHASCQQCLYAFEIDTYGRGCSHNCVYCYAKAELTVHGYWNNPIPVPIDINEVRHIFYTVFETDRSNKWREVIERRIPLRIGCMSDSFMKADLKYKVTQELLRILKFYRYPHTIITRSDLVAHDKYIPLIDPKLASIQLSISSTNDELNKKLEPGAPYAEERLLALEKLNRLGYWTAVRINPLFPIYPDGYFTNPNFKWNGPVPAFPYSSFEMVDEIADTGTPAIICGFGRFSAFAFNNIQRATGFDLRTFFDRENVFKSNRDFHYSEREIRHYYEEIKRRCDRRGVEFTVCYIGNGEDQFWDTRDLWSNKSDCCNIKGKIASFQTDARELSYEARLKFTSHKNSAPVSDRLHEALDEPAAPGLTRAPSGLTNNAEAEVSP